MTGLPKLFRLTEYYIDLLGRLLIYTKCDPASMGEPSIYKICVMEIGFYKVGVL